MKPALPQSFGAHLRSLREAAGFTQEELATIAGLSVHAVSALERGERRRPQFETVRSLSTALDLSEPSRNALLASHLHALFSVFGPCDAFVSSRERSIRLFTLCTGRKRSTCGTWLRIRSSARSN